MLCLILSSIFIFTSDSPFQIDQVNYYYFTTEGCIPCKRQRPIIDQLRKEGFDFEIFDDPENFEISAYPTVIIELVDYKQRKIKRIKLIGFHSYNKLKAALTKNK